MSNYSANLISDDEDGILPVKQNVVRKSRQAKHNIKYYSVDITSDEDNCQENDDQSLLTESKKIKSKQLKVRETVNTDLKIMKNKCTGTKTKLTIKKEKNHSKTEMKVKKVPKRGILKPKVNTKPLTKNESEDNIELSIISDDEDDKMLTEKPKAKERKMRKRKSTNDITPEETLSTTILSAKKLRIIGPSSSAKETLWKDYELLAENMHLNIQIAKNVINLFDNGSTIPFIARYRRNATGNMSPEVLRDVKNSYDDICNLKEKISTVLNSLEKTGHTDKQLENMVKSSKSIDELEIIYAPYKPEGKRTLAERAKALGLEKPAIELLCNTSTTDLTDWVDISKKELKTLEEVEKGIIHIIAHKIVTDYETLEFLRNIRKDNYFTIETKKLLTKQTSEKAKKNQLKGKPVDEVKYKLYFDFKISVRNVKPHQVLAINRGEHNKVLSVKINTPDCVKDRFHQFCSKKWIYRGQYNRNRNRILEEAIKDSYIRLVQPLIVREIRSELKTMAEKASYEVFSNNLKQILLASPMKGQTILGIDPGYTHGCKIAIISSTGKVLDHGVVYPHSYNNCNKNIAEETIKNMLHKYNCSLIALGDGTASKATEEWLTHLIKDRYFYPIDVKYTIVSENGASIYSCSPEAKKEFPDMDSNIISAVSLARRIQDPLAELVKVEPKHLGVGMYQHDLKKKALNEALDEVVSECVSFVGVDLNTASQCLLRRISGLTDRRATEIVKYREKNGSFLTRKELLEVTGIGPKVFEQCAGFLRICPTTAMTSELKNVNMNKLDQTIIHPESYELTKKLLKSFKFEIDDIGDKKLINEIKSIKTELSVVSEKLTTNVETLNLICDALEKPLNYDLRCELPQAAFFTTGLKSINDLSIGSKILGRVKNVTHFGCFVDIGVGKDGLIHCSELKGYQLQIGDKVEGEICSLDYQTQRIGIKPNKKVLINK